MNSEQISKYLNSSLEWLRALDEKFFSYVETLPRLELALQILILTVVFILVLTVIIAFAVVLLRIKNNWNARRYMRLEKSWEGQIMTILADGMESQIKPIKVAKSQRLFYVQYLYRFASRLRGQELDMIKTLARPHLGMIARRINSGYPELRARNINILATLGFPEFIAPIIEALHDGAPIVKMAAARILAHADYPQHIDLILPELSSFDEWSMNFLASMLSEMGAEVAPRLRAELVSGESSIRVRIAAAEALRRIGDLAAADTAVDVLKQGRDPELSAACLKILANLGTTRHRPLLLKLVQSDQEIIRLHALSALGSVGNSEDEVILENAMNDASSWVVLQAARAMVKIKGLEKLIHMAESEHVNAGVARQVLAEVQG